MSFTPPQPRIPTSIGRITVILSDQPEVEGGPFPQPAEQSASYSLDVLDQDGVVIPFQAASGNLAPHLTTGEIQSLQAFMSALRIRAEQQLLGSGG